MKLSKKWTREWARRTVAGFLAGGLCLMTPLAGWTLTGRPFSSAILWAAAGFGLLFAALYPATQIYQVEEDQARGDRTLVVRGLPGDALRLREKLLGALHRLLKLLERGVWQAREIAGLIYQHGRFILKLGDLLIDLLERARRRQDVLRIVGRIIDDPLCGGRRGEDWRQRERRGKERGADAQRA